MANILIVDDEEALLKLLASFLRRNGHTTVLCASAESALEQFQSVNRGIDILIADVSLDGGSGVEVGVDLYGLSPTLKILFMSGYPLAAWNVRDAALFTGLPPDSVLVLQKPFSSRDLLLRVEALIARSPEALGSRHSAMGGLK